MTSQGDDKKLTIRRRGGFTKIPNSVAQDERLSLQARGFLAYLLSLPETIKITPIKNLINRSMEPRLGVIGFCLLNVRSTNMMMRHIDFGLR